MSTVTKKDLVEKVMEKNDMHQNVIKEIIQMFLDTIVEELSKGNRLEFRDFGVFEVVQRAPRKAQNPKTLEPVIVPAKKVVKFKPGKKLKDLIQASLEKEKETVSRVKKK
ncbi:MAG: integration host factor subunit beta [Planctomycetota bacterium]|nr:MAG: integration host factor subunit beta [Planctomycetota bacterium]